MGKYRAVIFDLFGTLVDSLSSRRHDEVTVEMARIVGAPERAFHALWLAEYPRRGSGYWDTVEACIAHVCATLGVPADETTVREAAGPRRRLIRSALEPRPDAPRVLTELRARGLRVGLITDCPPEVPEYWPETPFAPLIDAAVFSSAVHLMKPDPRIYGVACERLGVSPGACLFVGDGGSRELTGAQAVGMDAVCIAPPHVADQDPHRIDPDTWTGPVIGALEQVLDWVARPYH